MTLRVPHSLKARMASTAPAVAATGTALAVAMVAVLVLFGWALDVEVLKSLLHPGRIAMNPTTAVCFLLLAASLWLSRGTPPLPATPRNVARALALLVILVAACRLLSYAFGLHLPVDELLFRSRLEGNIVAPNTAVAFVLAGTALLMLDAPFRPSLHPAIILAIATGCIGMLSLTGYLYGMMRLYGVRGHIPMALNTSITFVVLATGIVGSRPDREPLATALSPTLGGVVARRLVPAAFLVPLLLGWLRLEGENHDLYDNTYGLAVFVLANILVFNLLIWWCAHVLHNSDARRQKTEDQLRLSERRYHAVMEQAADGIYLVDLDSKKLLESNPALDRLLGYPVGETRALTVFDLVFDAPEHVADRLHKLEEAGHPLQGERQYRRKDGSPVDVFSSAAIISYGDRKVACTVVHDITARKRFERELQEKNRQLEQSFAAERQALEQLRKAQSQLVENEKLAGLGQMVAGVAHEINNPLSFVSNNVAVLQRDVRAFTDLLALYGRADATIAERDPALIAEIRDLCERVDLAYTTTNLKDIFDRSREGLRRIQQIVKDLRDFARLDESDLHEVDLSGGIESTVNIVRGRAKKKRVQIDMDLKTLPAITCYPARINQVVMNLVANAIDACPEGGRVSVRSARDGADGVRIEVADTGTGVPQHIRNRIFDPFFTTKPVGEGTGLGLSISYGIVQDHGGTITIADAPGGGALFTVTLPNRRPTATPSPTPTATPPRDERPTLHQPSS